MMYNKGNTAQRPPDGFAAHLLAYFPASAPQSLCGVALKMQFTEKLTGVLSTIANKVERRQKFRFYQSKRVYERQRGGGQAGSA